jgi:hypothetical protein
MKIVRSLLRPALAIVASLAGASAAQAGTFNIYNSHGSATIQRLWTAPAIKGTPWQEFYLDFPVEARTVNRFTLSNGSYCLYDMKVRFSDGYEQTFSNVNICRGDRVVAS